MKLGSGAFKLCRSTGLGGGPHSRSCTGNLEACWPFQPVLPDTESVLTGGLTCLKACRVLIRLIIGKAKLEWLVYR